MPSLLRWIAAAILTFGFASLSFAQTDRAGITGTITDPNGSTVPGARVTATAAATGLKRTVTTTSSGSYSMTALPIGKWTVSVAANGFETLEVADFELQVGQTRTIDVRLTVGGVQTKIEVSAEAPLVQSSAVVGGVISGEQIQNLPVNGRNWASLMSLVPGGIDTGVNDEKSVRFAGRATDDNNFRFDGVDATGIQNQGQRTSTRLQMSSEAIAEFRVSSSLFTAETGGTAGGQVEIVSKTGSNNFHGSAFEFLRNSYFDSRSFDSRLSKLPAFRLNQYGGSLGGAIFKDKTFFFVNYEGFKQTLGQPLAGTVPSALFRAAVLAKSPAMKPILDAYPTGTSSTSDKNVDNWFGNGTQRANEDAGLFRIDHRINDKTSAFVRFNMDSAAADVPLGASGLFLRDRLGTTIKPYNAIISVQRIFSPTILNDLKVGFNRSDFFTVNESISPFAVTVPSFTTLNNSISKIARSNSFSFLDNATFIFGRHTVKAGVEIRRVQINQSATATDDLTVAYANVTDFTNNVVSSATLNATVPVTGLRKTSAFGFVQDEFKLRPNLTLNIGLRYEFFGVFSEVNNNYIAFDPKSCPLGFCPKGSDFYFPDLGDFAPRVSFSWAPKAMRGKTVVRGGFGLYYGEAQLGDLNAPVNNIAVREALTSSNTPGLSYPVAPFLATTTISTQ